MKLLKKDIKHGEIKCLVEDQDDLWYLSQIIMPKDIAKSSTLRKIRLGGEDDRSARIIKKRVYLSIEVEKVEFSGSSLRVLGVITDGPDDIPKGSHHSFSLEPGSRITLIKEEWLRLHLEKLDEACKTESRVMLICIFDRETAYFGLLKRSGVHIISKLEGQVQKKDFEQQSKSFYPQVISALEQYYERYKPPHVVLASPSFWKEELLKVKKPSFPLVQATVSSVTENAFEELLKRPELKELLKQQRVAQDSQLVEELMAELSKDGKATYGLEHVKLAAEAGAVEMLILSDRFLMNAREDGTDDEIDLVMKQVERAKGKVHIISSEHDPGKKLDGISGIAVLLRYKV
ncbi:MAG: mRNA surveillance protein pelota [Nanoarchaeota archaeon]|nr:mRNA surveillance protein pelota [Nanoarchaeota archaeon]